MASLLTVVKKEIQTVVVDTVNPTAGYANAEDVNYDNSSSGLTATQLQAATDELAQDKHTHTNKAILDATEAPYTVAEQQKLQSLELTTDLVSKETRVNTSEGLTGGKALDSDIDLALDLNSLPTTTDIIDPVSGYLVVVKDGVQSKTSSQNLPYPSGFRVVGDVSPLAPDRSSLEVVSSGNTNIAISQNTPPRLEEDIHHSVDGYVFVVVLSEAQKQTGVNSYIQDSTDFPSGNLLFDGDQLMWVADDNNPSTGKWIQLETGDAVIDFNGRVGKVSPQLGDYPASLIPMSDGKTVEQTVSALPHHTEASFEPTTAKAGDFWTDTTDPVNHVFKVYFNGAWVALLS